MHLAVVDLVVEVLSKLVRHEEVLRLWHICDTFEFRLQREAASRRNGSNYANGVPNEGAAFHGKSNTSLASQIAKNTVTTTNIRPTAVPASAAPNEDSQACWWQLQVWAKIIFLGFSYLVKPA